MIRSRPDIKDEAALKIIGLADRGEITLSAVEQILAAERRIAFDNGVESIQPRDQNQLNPAA